MKVIRVHKLNILYNTIHKNSNQFNVMTILKKNELKHKYNEKLCGDCHILFFKTRNKINNQRN